MSYDSSMYVHDMDRKAFSVLNKFPAFLKMVKMYSANFDEKAARIDLLSSSVKLGDNQMPEVYNLLPPVCEKLGINQPDLFMEKSGDINAYTGGIDEPYICITSRLAKTLSPEMISSVLAHECGHIACEHNLYHSLATVIASNVDNLASNVPILRKYIRYITPTLITALIFWDRCSELSADRAALLCDGNADITVDTLMKVHGYDSKINRDAFIEQAMELKEYVNESKTNKMIEAMLTSTEDHPRLATRVYECVDWSNSEQYKDIVSGNYLPDKAYNGEGQIVEKDVIDAQITVNTNQGELTVSEEELDLALNRVNTELDRYTNKADKADYAVAVASGIVSGVIDALYVGEFSVKGDSLGLAHKQVNKFIQGYAKARGFDDDRLKDAIIDLEDNFKVAQDNVWKGADIGVSAKKHHLADLAHHPTPLGLMSAIIVRFLRVGTFVNKDGEWHFVPVETDVKDLMSIIAPAVLTGFLNWLLNIAETADDEDEERQIPEAILKLARLIACSPILIEVIKCADNWFGHLVSDMGGSRSTAGAGMGIPGVFLSLLYEVSALPMFKGTGFTAALDDLYEKQKLDMRHELGIINEFGKQAVPVMFNELFVRSVYFLSHFALELDKGQGLKGVNWTDVIPFGNRTIDRMMTVASMTFTVADTADAAVHAAIESGGNWVLFSGRFVTRFNYIGAGGAALAIVKEVSNEQKEEQLIREKLLLSDMKTALTINQLQEYEKQLEERLADYLAEDIESFMEGFDLMEEGINTGDSDKVIRGNVIIQKVLGREPQFTNQKEFDELMDSDMPLQL